MKYAKTLTAALLTLSADAAAQNQEYVRQSPAPSDVHLYGLDFVDSDNGWAVGDSPSNGGIWKTTDGGATWETCIRGSLTDMRAIDMFDASTGIEVGSSIFKTTNGGASWTESNLPSTPAGHDPAVQGTQIQLVSQTTGWLSTRPSGAVSYLYRTTNGGGSWQYLGDFDLESWHFADENVGWAADLSANFVRTNDGGQTWSPVPMPPATIGCCSTVARVFSYDEAIVTTFQNSTVGFTTHHTTDGGQTWVSSAPGAPRHPEFLDSSTGWGWIQFGNMAKTTDGGETWTSQLGLIDIHEHVRDLAIVDENSLYFSGDFGYVYKSEDGGSSWQPASDGSGQYLEKIAFANSQKGWATGRGRTILRTENGGETWTHQRFPTDPLFLSSPTNIHIFGPDHAMIHLGEFGADGNGFTGVMTTTDGGTTWTHADPNSQWPYGIVYFADPDHGYVVTKFANEFSKTTDGGDTWTTFQTGLSGFSVQDSVLDVFFVDDMHGWFVGRFGLAYRTVDGGQTWFEMPNLPGVLRDVRFADENNGWISANHGGIYHTTDGGVTWTEQTQPDSLDEHLQDLVVVSPSEAYVCSSKSINGAYLRHTTDAGQTWNFEYLGPGVLDPYFGITNGIAVFGDNVWTVGTQGVIRHKKAECLADVNGDGQLTPTDFTAWIAAFNAGSSGCDQNGDGSCTPTDFTAWINNYNDGC